MRLLLDTNIVIMLVEGGHRLSAAQKYVLEDRDNSPLTSVASLWEVAIKVRSGKLELHFPVEELRVRLRRYRVGVMSIHPDHAVHEPDLPDNLKDPFDRLITAVAELEGLTLLTTDRELLKHPLAWRP